MVLFMAFNYFQSKQPFPDSGGRVVAIHNDSEWENQVAKKQGDPVLVDFYATWCPPCRRAAPIFGELSLKYTGCDFVKVDVDQCRGVAKACNVSSMPTFQLYRNGRLMDEVIGFSTANIEAMLKKGGVSNKPRAD
eukprot:CAMPEP_0172643976 /NCGR_PEP_ID=MMETSP1068-20121228/238972_1 /TAXON_ID=35684 /ORGANISM="Pseudopedinella elastica, Strain CCMP716" /LENGTH=134 /DNA_ID=CAMNT_0013458155 /DNA_START=731 /DNA_END=1135 /DNA_ORIENTATION=+